MYEFYSTGPEPYVQIPLECTCCTKTLPLLQQALARYRSARDSSAVEGLHEHDSGIMEPTHRQPPHSIARCWVD